MLLKTLIIRVFNAFTNRNSANFFSAVEIRTSHFNYRINAGLLKSYYDLVCWLLNVCTR